MPGAVRAKRDIFGLGGTCCIGSCDVQVNGAQAVRVGDIVVPHLAGKRHKIPNPVTTGACQVLVNGRKMVRQGDVAACLDPAVSGSCDVQVGNQLPNIQPQNQIPSMVLPPGAINVEGRVVFENTTQGIESLASQERSVSASLPGYHEEPPGSVPGQSAPTPVAVPPEGCKVSKYFKLADSKMAIVAQDGLTKEQIECNWIALCLNILDRLTDDGYKFKINSGFRTVAYDLTLGSSNASDHRLGCAVDISAGSAEANKAIFKHMLNNYAYSQLIYEGNWVHIAYNGRGPKGAARVMYSYTGSNLQVAGARGENLPADLRA
jgi:uncharacterized Zn-binding protein involved in type VI secretion